MLIEKENRESKNTKEKKAYTRRQKQAREY